MPCVCLRDSDNVVAAKVFHLQVKQYLYVMYFIKLREFFSCFWQKILRLITAELTIILICQLTQLFTR
jgi:hypothetical protein